MSDTEKIELLEIRLSGLEEITRVQQSMLEMLIHGNTKIHTNIEAPVNKGSIPRMRGIKEAYAYVMEKDPQSKLSFNALRKMIISGQIPCKRVGSKYLVDLDNVDQYLREGAQTQPQTSEKGKIRRINL